MNKDNAKDYLPLVQALADGKTIQIKGIKSWHDKTALNFDSPPEHYRIKPEPREFDLWVTFLSSGEICSATNSNMSQHFPDWVKIRVREIVE